LKKEYDFSQGQRGPVAPEQPGKTRITIRIDTMLAGDVATGKAILRDYINAAVGFGYLSEATDIPAKSLMRMFGPARPSQYL
jgi:hypothetical protein